MLEVDEELLQELDFDVKLLSYENSNRLRRFITDLQETNLKVNSQLLNNFLKIITIKLPKNAPETLVENTFAPTDFRKTRERAKIVLSNNVTFFVENSTRFNARGGYASIKKAYRDEVKKESEKPIYVRKHFFPVDDTAIKNGYENALQSAMREVKYNKLLGRAAYFYQENESSYMVAQWKPSKKLSCFHRDTLRVYAVERRLQWLESLVLELNILHENYRIHGDIKEDNVILNIEKNSLNLIDFGTARKAETSKKFSFTSRYRDYASEQSTFYADLFALSFIIAKLFPDFIIESYDYPRSKFGYCSNLSLLGQAVVDLFESLRYQEVKRRCSCYDVLEFIRELINTAALDNERFQKLKESTIHKKEISFDDVVHGVTCRQ